MGETVGGPGGAAVPDAPADAPDPPVDPESARPGRSWLPPGVEAGVHTELEERAAAGDVLLHAGEGWVGSTHEIPWHTHGGWELYLQLHGRSTWLIEQVTVELAPGWLLAVPPGAPHHGSTAARWRGRHHFTYAAVRPQSLGPGYAELSATWADRSVSWTPDAWRLAPVFRSVVEETAADQRFAGAARTAAAALLLSQAARLLTPRELERPGVAAVRHPGVERARQLLDDDFAQSWTVPDLAAACGLSRTRLAQLFGEQVGQAPYEYVLERRVERAAELLATTPSTVADVAAQVGFSSRVQLARHFRRLRGTSPRQWREQQALTDPRGARSPR